MKTLSLYAGNCSDVWAASEWGAGVPQKVLICQEFGQNLKKSEQSSFNISKQSERNYASFS